MTEAGMAAALAERRRLRRFLVTIAALMLAGAAYLVHEFTTMWGTEMTDGECTAAVSRVVATDVLPRMPAGSYRPRSVDAYCDVFDDGQGYVSVKWAKEWSGVQAIEALRQDGWKRPADSKPSWETQGLTPTGGATDWNDTPDDAVLVTVKRNGRTLRAEVVRDGMAVRIKADQLPPTPTASGDAPRADQ